MYKLYSSLGPSTAQVARVRRVVQRRVAVLAQIGVAKRGKELLAEASQPEGWQEAALQETHVASKARRNCGHAPMRGNFLDGKA